MLQVGDAEFCGANCANRSSLAVFSYERACLSQEICRDCHALGFHIHFSPHHPSSRDATPSKNYASRMAHALEKCMPLEAHNPLYISMPLSFGTHSFDESQYSNHQACSMSIHTFPKSKFVMRLLSVPNDDDSRNMKSHVHNDDLCGYEILLRSKVRFGYGSPTVEYGIACVPLAHEIILKI
eukprot:IDg9141t1